MPFASIVASLAPLAILACPVGMGLMMFMMGRGSRGRREQPPPSLEQLREEHQRLGAEIERLEQERSPERV